MGRGAPLPGGQSTGSDAAEQALIALVRGASERARITDALRARSVEVIFVDRVAELTDAVMRTQLPIAAMVVEVRDADGRALHEVVGGLHAGGSGIPLVAYCRAGAEYSSDIRALVMAGAHQLLFHGIDDAGVALRHVLDSANQASVGERVATELMRVVPKKLATFVSHVTRCPDTKQVADVAEALGYHRKTLLNHCTQADFIPPHELLCWCRLAVAAEMMASCSRTIESIALQLDFPSDTSLRNMMKRYTGLKASEVRERGGAKCVVAALQRVCPPAGESRSRAG